MLWDRGLEMITDSPSPRSTRAEPPPSLPRGARAARSPWPAALAALALAAVLGAVGCQKDDVGTCCKVLPGSDQNLIPRPDPENPALDLIKLDPAFDCSGLTCVSYQGSAAYCTRECTEVADCPEGFDCRSVLQSDPGPGSNLRPSTKFCIRDQHVCGP